MPPAPPIRSVAVFCGSRTGHDPDFARAAAALGTGLAERELRLIYGGGRIGLMGVVADAVLAGGGNVSGVIPEFLTRTEAAHEHVHDLTVTDSMHTRKQRMFSLADAFVTMPGGLGTLDETVEIITWRQLRLHDKPVLICNVGGWADGLLAAFAASVRDGFSDEPRGTLFEVLPDVAAVLRRLENAPVPASGQVDRM